MNLGSIPSKFENLYYRVLVKLISISSRIGFLHSFNKFLIKRQKYILQMRIIDDTFLNYVWKKRQGLSYHASEIKVIGIRGSNADYGFYPSMIDGAYNLGLTSSDLYITYWMYVNCLKNLPKLETVILYYSVSACGYSLIHTFERYREYVYSYFFDFPIQSPNELSSRKISQIRNRCESLMSNHIGKSYFGYETKSAFMVSSAKDRVVTHLRENRREPDQLDWLSKLSSEIQEDRRNLYIVITPFRSDYKAVLPKKEELFHKLYGLHLGETTRILDFYDSNLLDDTDFGDTDHLNEKGAIKLTEELKKEIEKTNLS